MPKNRYVNPVLKNADELKKLRAQYTLQEIGDMFGTTIDVVRYRCKALGITVRGSNNRHRVSRGTVVMHTNPSGKPPAILQNEAWLRRALETNTPEQIAQWLGCHPEQVKKAINNWR